MNYAACLTRAVTWSLQVREMVSLIRGDLAPAARSTLMCLVTLDVHGRDIVKDLADKSVTAETDFQWLAQLRYYQEDGHTAVRQINTRVAYGYEYLGNTPRLVITPLTDRSVVGICFAHMFSLPDD